MRKIISFLLILAMLFSFCLYYANAEYSDSRVIVFAAEEKSAEQGSIAEYKLSLEFNDNIQLRGIVFNLNFDKSAFYIDSVTLGANFLSADVEIQNVYGYVVFVWESNSNIITSAELLTVKLKTFSDAVCRTYYPQISNLEIYDNNIEDVPAWTGDIGGIKVTETEPTDITSAIYSISEEYIGKIAIGTKVSGLINGINEKNYVQVYENNIKAENADTLKTGMTVKLITNDTVVKTLTVVVTGDVSGSGEVLIISILMMKSHLTGESTLSNAVMRAADINGDKIVSIKDLIQIEAYLLRKGSIEPKPVW